VDQDRLALLESADIDKRVENCSVYACHSGRIGQGKAIEEWKAAISSDDLAGAKQPIPNNDDGLTDTDVFYRGPNSANEAAAFDAELTLVANDPKGHHHVLEGCESANERHGM
jgi:hypothetical protein